jgi:hypothetical protein
MGEALIRSFKPVVNLVMGGVDNFGTMYVVDAKANDILFGLVRKDVLRLQARARGQLESQGRVEKRGETLTHISSVRGVRGIPGLLAYPLSTLNSILLWVHGIAALPQDEPLAFGPDENLVAFVINSYCPREEVNSALPHEFYVSRSLLREPKEPWQGARVLAISRFPVRSRVLASRYPPGQGASYTSIKKMVVGEANRMVIAPKLCHVMYLSVNGNRGRFEIRLEGQVQQCRFTGSTSSLQEIENKIKECFVVFGLYFRGHQGVPMTQMFFIGTVPGELEEFQDEIADVLAFRDAWEGKVITTTADGRMV